MICEKCGKVSPDSARFCGFCGAALPTVSSEQEKGAMPEADAAPEKTETREELSGAVTETLTKPEAETETDTAPEAEDMGTVLLTDTKQYEFSADEAPADDLKPKKTGKKVPIGLRILSAFLCIILFALAASASCVGIARGLLNENNLMNAVSQMSLSDVTIRGESLAKMIYDSCDADKVERYGLTERGIKRLLDDVDVNSALENLVLPYVRYMLGKENRLPDIEAKDIIREVKHNEKVIYKVLNYQLSEADYEVMERELAQVLDGLDLEKTIDEAVSEAARAVTRYITVIYGILIALSVVLVLLVFVCNRMSLRESTQHLAVAFFALTVVFGGVCLGLFGYMFTNSELQTFLQPLLAPCGIRAGGYLFLGALSLVLCLVSGKRRRAEKKKKQAA